MNGQFCHNQNFLDLQIIFFFFLPNVLRYLLLNLRESERITHYNAILRLRAFYPRSILLNVCSSFDLFQVILVTVTITFSTMLPSERK